MNAYLSYGKSTISPLKSRVYNKSAINESKTWSMILVSSVRTSTTYVVNVCDEVRVARMQHRDAITGSGFLLKRHIGLIPITVCHVTIARYRHVRRRCLPRRDARHYRAPQFMTRSRESFRYYRQYRLFSKTSSTS